MTFDPKKHVIRIEGGREYLPVAARLVWFRNEHPDWGIVTSPIEINMEKLYAIFACQIFNAEGKLMATATKMENVRGFGDFLEKAETGAVGRALAYCGYGTQFAPELEEASRYADAPYPSAGSPALAANSASPAANSASPAANSASPAANSASPAANSASPAANSASPAANFARPNAESSSRYAGSAGGVQRVREPERNLADPGGSEEEGADPFVDEEAAVAEDGGVPVSAAPAPAATRPVEKPNHLAGNHCTVEGCKNVLTAGQMTMSVNKFGRALCLLHQKDANIDGGGAAQGANRRNPDGARSSSGSASS